MLPRGVKRHIRPTLLGHRQIDTGWRQVTEVPPTIERQIIFRFAFELLHHLLILTVDPACGIDTDRLIDGIYLVFVLQPVSHYLELQHADGTDHNVVAAQGEKDLGRALFRQLLQPLLQLFRLEWIAQADTAEQLRGEMGNAGVVQTLPFSEGIANLNGAMIM